MAHIHEILDLLLVTADNYPPCGGCGRPLDRETACWTLESSPVCCDCCPDHWPRGECRGEDE